MNEETKSRENLNSNVTKVTSSLKLQKLDYIAQMATDYRETLLNPTEESDVALAIGATEELVTEMTNDKDMFSAVGSIIPELDGSLRAFRMHDATRTQIGELLGNLAETARNKAEELETNAKLIKRLFTLCAEHAEEISEIIDIGLLCDASFHEIVTHYKSQK